MLLVAERRGRLMWEEFRRQILHLLPTLVRSKPREIRVFVKRPKIDPACS
jgi:hypothetical protein